MMRHIATLMVMTLILLPISVAGEQHEAKPGAEIRYSKEAIAASLKGETLQFLEELRTLSEYAEMLKKSYVGVGLVLDGQVVAEVKTASTKAAGLREGDKIIRVDGAAVSSAEEIIALVRSTDEQKAGSTITLTVVREEGKIDIKVQRMLAWRGQPEEIARFREEAGKFRDGIVAFKTACDKLVAEMNDGETISVRDPRFTAINDAWNALHNSREKLVGWLGRIFNQAQEAAKK